MVELPHVDNTRDLPPARMAELLHDDKCKRPSGRMGEVPHDHNTRNFPPARMAGLPHDDNARDFPLIALRSFQIQDICDT
jgi:hypothetical protein